MGFVLFVVAVHRELRRTLGELILGLSEQRIKIFDFSDRLFDLYDSAEIETDSGANAVAAYFLALDTIIYDGYLEPVTEEQATFVAQVLAFLDSDLEYRLANPNQSNWFGTGPFDQLPPYFPFASEEEAKSYSKAVI